MARSVTITTSIPTLEEWRDSLGVSKERQQSLISMLQSEVPAADRTEAVKAPKTANRRKRAAARSRGKEKSKRGKTGR